MNENARPWRALPWMALGLAMTCFLVQHASAEDVLVLPPDATGMTQPAEYSFGSETQSKDWRATVRVLDQLEARFGEKSMRIFIRNLDAGADPQAIKAYYATQLVQQDGWTEMALDPFLPGDDAWAFAFVSPDGRQVLAVEALDASEGAGGIVPLNILTNLDDDGNPNTR